MNYFEVEKCVEGILLKRFNVRMVERSVVIKCSLVFTSLLPFLMQCQMFVFK